MNSQKSVDNRKLYIWNLLGTISSSLVSTVLLLFASRMLSPATSDLFGISYSLGQQLIIIGLFQVRDYQATDTCQKYPFSTYLNTRLLTVTLMVISSFAFIIINQYDANKSIIFLLIVLYRACDAFSDVFQGYFQQHGRSDLAGKILFFRSSLAILIFYSILLVTESLLQASMGIFVINLLLTYFLDFRYLKTDFPKVQDKGEFNFPLIKSLAMSCFPLFINGFLITYIFNEPKLVIDDLLSLGSLVTGLQRDFNILFLPTFIMPLLLMVLRPMITKLSELWFSGEVQKFYSQFRTIALSLVFMGIIVVILGYLIGTEVLGAIYGVDLSAYKLSFALLLIGGILNMLASIVGNIMTIFRKQTSLLFVYIVTFVVSKLVTRPLVSEYSLLGASISFLISMIVFLVLSLIIYQLVKRVVMK